MNNQNKNFSHIVLSPGKIDSYDIQEDYFEIAIINMIKELKGTIKKCQNGILHSGFLQNAKAQTVNEKMKQFKV